MGCTRHWAKLASNLKDVNFDPAVAWAARRCKQPSVRVYPSGGEVCWSAWLEYGKQTRPPERGVVPNTSLCVGRENRALAGLSSVAATARIALRSPMLPTDSAGPRRHWNAR